MKIKITIKNQKQLSETKDFLSRYLERKNRIDNGPYLSFYISDNSQISGTSRNVRFVKMLKEVELTLKSQLNPKMAKKFMVQLNKLDPIEIVKTNKMSVAFFISEEFAGFVFVPFPVFENVVVAQSLHLKPILSWIKSGDQFYLIDLSLDTCRFFKGDSFSLSEISIVTMKKSKLLLLSQVEEKIYQFVKDDNFPVITVGNKLHTLDKSFSSDSNLLKERVIGNLDQVNSEAIHEACLNMVSKLSINHDQNILSQYKDMKTSGKVIEDLNEITIAAIQGRIFNLIIASDRSIWGNLDKVTGKISTHINKNLAFPEDDILDDLAEIVIARGGAITLLKHNEMPSDNEAIALLK